MEYLKENIEVAKLNASQSRTGNQKWGDKMDLHQYSNVRHDRGSFSWLCNSVTPMKGRMNNAYIGLRRQQKALRTLNNSSIKNRNNQGNETIGTLVERVTPLLRRSPRIKQVFLVYDIMIVHKRRYTNIDTNKRIIVYQP